MELSEGWVFESLRGLIFLVIVFGKIWFLDGFLGWIGILGKVRRR